MEDVTPRRLNKGKNRRHSRWKWCLLLPLTVDRLSQNSRRRQGSASKAAPVMPSTNATNLAVRLHSISLSFSFGSCLGVRCLGEGLDLVLYWSFSSITFSFEEPVARCVTSFASCLPNGVVEACVGAVRELLRETHGAPLGAARLGDLVVSSGRVPRQPGPDKTKDNDKPQQQQEHDRHERVTNQERRTRT